MDTSECILAFANIRSAGYVDNLLAMSETISLCRDARLRV